MTKFRTEFATEGRWYTNALRFDTPEPAVEEAASRFMRWLVPSAWRVVTDDTPQKQPYTGTMAKEDPTAFKVTDASGQEIPVQPVKP